LRKRSPGGFSGGCRWPESHAVAPQRQRYPQGQQTDDRPTEPPRELGQRRIVILRKEMNYVTATQLGGVYKDPRVSVLKDSALLEGCSIDCCNTAAAFHHAHDLYPGIVAPQRPGDRLSRYQLGPAVHAANGIGVGRWWLLHQGVASGCGRGTCVPGQVVLA